MALLAALMVVSVVVPAQAKGGAEDRTVRFATFNASLNRFSEGSLAAELATPGSVQPDAIAEIIQRVL